MHRLPRRLSSVPTPERSCRQSVGKISVASDSSPQKSRGRKVSKDERRSMVESFVNKYKVMNSGKFPAVTDVRNGVGGSYYVVKKIVQELQYETLTQSTGTSNTFPMPKKTENELSVNYVEVSSRHMTVGEAITLDIQPSRYKESTNREPLGTADQVACSQKIEIPDVYMENLGKEVDREDDLTQLVDEIEEEARSDSHLQKNAVSEIKEMAKEQLPSQDIDLSGINKVETLTKEGDEIISSAQELTDSNSVPDFESPQAGELTRKQVEPGKSIFGWKHLKSLADGIMRIWRKQ